MSMPTRATNDWHSDGGDSEAPEAPTTSPGPDAQCEEAESATAEQLLGLTRRCLEAESDETYFPPTDPVVVGEEIVGGFSATSMDPLEIEPSELDGQIGDEALADAIRQELQGDSATSALDIKVTVKNHVVHLHGVVPDIEDVENAEEVAARLPQVLAVVEHLILASC